jgi:predicted HNH restriction endonuclease
LNVHEDRQGNRTVWCVRCEPERGRNLSEHDKYSCHACHEIRSDCVTHHVSYDPEYVVPVCTNCHGRIHGDDDFRPELTPDMSRTQAEDRGCVSIIGLDNSWIVED